MNKRAFHARIREIEKKYEVLRYHIYGRWLREADKAVREAGLGTFAERNKLPTYQRGEGLTTAMQILEHAPNYEIAVQRLASQVTEPSVSSHFAEAVQLILNDLQAESVEPLQFPNLLESEKV
jgi:hypothetical protein